MSPYNLKNLKYFRAITQIQMQQTNLNWQIFRMDF